MIFCGVHFLFRSLRFLSGCRFAPNRSAGSNAGTRFRFEQGWPACHGSRLPFATDAESRRVPRPMLRSFALKRDLDSTELVEVNRHKTRPLVRPPLDMARPPRYHEFEGRSDKRGCEGQLRSSMRSKLRCNGRRRRELIRLAGEGTIESYRASQRCAKRGPVTTCERGNLFGTGCYNDKNLPAFRAVGRNVTIPAEAKKGLVAANDCAVRVRGKYFAGCVASLMILFLLGLLATPSLVFADASPGSGLKGLDDNALYSELANRGLDDLLKRVMDEDHVPPEQRAAVSSMSSLFRLDSEKNLTDDQRQALLDTAVAGLDRILATLHNDPDLLLKQAKIIADYGVDPLTGLLEYWGDSDVERDRLHPLADAAFKMYDLADQTASAQANDLANRITSPDDKLADQWKAASQTAAAAAYQRARMQYAQALSLDPTDSQRQQLIEQALKTFADWDNSDSQIQAQVRLLMAKLHVLTGDKDEFAEAQKLLDSIINNRDNEISPAPTPEMIFEAKCYKVIACLAAGDLASAQQALSAATAYQQSNFPDDRDQAAALRLLSYRILAMRADQLPVGNAKDAANASAVEALAQLVRDFPNLRDAIFRQLAARLPANPDLTKLDPVLLLALVDQGRQTIVAASPMHPASVSQLHEAADAAREILSRMDNKNFPRADAADASFLLGIFQEHLGDKIGAAESLLDHIDRFRNDPNAHADVALNTAREIIAELRNSSPADPHVQQLEDRFLPIAINPPFNQHQFALQYAASLFDQSKWSEAIKYYRMVPGDEPPGRLLIARYGEMISLKKELEDSPNLGTDQKQQWTTQIQNLADSVITLANQIVSSDASVGEKARARSTLARMTLIAADISRRERNDPQRVLELLKGFENSVQGLADAKSLLNGALFLRVQAYMQLGRDNDATATLVKYLNTATPNEGAQAVRDLLATLNTELDQARRANNAALTRQLADNRAMLSGFLVKWAADSSDPKIHSYSYTYRRFDADTKRMAAELETDPAARQRDLAAALDLYKQLQSPENVKMYQAGLDPGADKDYPDPAVTLGIGLIAYEQGDCQTVKATLGRLIQDEKLGENNDQYWEAAYKLLDCMHTLAVKGDPDTTDAQVAQALKVLYLIWRDGTGGPKYHDKFESLRKEVLGNWQPPPPGQ
jgi:hypothetical protein